MTDWRAMSDRSICWVGCALLTVAGCTRDDPLLVPITGQVKLEGSPVAEVIVTFTPTGTTLGNGSLGATDTEGKFTLTDVRGGQGGHVGEYKISLYPAPTKDTQDLPSDVVSSGAIGLPPIFLNPNRTPLRATVPAEGAQVEILLTRTGTGAEVNAIPVQGVVGRNGQKD